MRAPLTITHLLVPTAVLAALLTSGASLASSSRLEFEGEQLWDNRTGLVVMPGDDNRFLVVTSLMHHYSIVFPYAEPVELETGPDDPLAMYSEVYHATLKIVRKRRNETDLEHLGEILGRLQESDGLTIDQPEFLEGEGRPVLRYLAQLTPTHKAEPEGSGISAWNYWAVASRRKTWYVLHISLRGADPDETESDLLWMMGEEFFRTDYDP